MQSELLKELRPCPFCKSDHTDGWTWIDKLKHDDRCILLHYCRPEPTEYDRVISVYGSSLEECVERWNADGKEQKSESL
jgi:hypothetical protein